MATFALVHWAVHAGWCWRDVQQRLTQGGHNVHRPTLTSLRRFSRDAVASGWELHELHCGHDMMPAAPAETADLLEKIAARG